MNVELHVSGGTAPVTLVRDKFLVTVIYLEEVDANNTRYTLVQEVQGSYGRYRVVKEGTG